MNKKPVWRFRMSLRESIVAIVVGVLAIGLFLGVIRVMAPDSPSEGTGTPPTTETGPPEPAEYPEAPASP